MMELSSEKKLERRESRFENQWSRALLALPADTRELNPLLGKVSHGAASSFTRPAGKNCKAVLTCLSDIVIEFLYI